MPYAWPEYRCQISSCGKRMHSQHLFVEDGSRSQEVACLVDSGTFRRHHAVDPVRIEQRLVDHRRLVVKLTVHGQVVASLQRNSAPGSYFFSSYGHADAHLAGHRSSANNRLVELQNSDHFPDAADIVVFGVHMIAWHVVLTWETSTMGWQVKSIHGALFHHPWVVHNTMILSAVGTGGVAEHNLLFSRSALLIEDFSSFPRQEG